MSARESQSLAEPSATAKQRIISPTASVRGSSQALPWPASASGCSTAGRNARVQRRITSSPATASVPRCSSIGTAAAVTATPIPAPRIVPRLNPAWNRGMTVRPSPRSTSAPSTFIATSHIPVPMP